MQQVHVKKHLWDGNLWPSWSAFVRDAGFTPNELTLAVPDSEMLRPLAILTRRFQRFPTVRERKYAHTRGDPPLPGEKTYRNRFKNRSGMVRRLLDSVPRRVGLRGLGPFIGSRCHWSSHGCVVPTVGSAPDGRCSPDNVGEFHPTHCGLLGGACRRRCSNRGGLCGATRDPNVEFERRVAIAMDMLGFDVARLGQGAGRVADGVARWRTGRWAVVYDAKVRRDGFAMQTEDRKFREYVEHHGRQLVREGVDAVYFSVISSSFDERDLTRAQDIVHATRAKAVALVEAGALTAMIDLKLRTRALDDWAAIQDLFGRVRIVTPDIVQRLE